MSKCAKCIEMLSILKSRGGYISKNELALRLEVNPRNIKEYRKELEEAGYVIEYKAGRYGGYALDPSCLLPLLRLSLAEEKALKIMARYIEEHKEIVHLKDMQSAMAKILSAQPQREGVDYAYRTSRVPKSTPKISYMITVLEEAIQECREVVIDYISTSCEEISKVHVFPYDLVCSNGFYYMIGYALHRKDYRVYKISEQRMKSVVVCERVFQRDSEYRLEDHIGKQGVYKGEEIEVKLEIHGPMATYIAENEVGLHSTMCFEGDTLHLTTTFESIAACDSFILSLGESGRVVGNEDVKKRIASKIKAMSSLYE
ncbi:MAG: WYL domain-containing transcriptional regulator [Erysipelotrichales bacterium]|nr:WYL domain-containing transcriptional regulator [Erysipelotrichales bacterium]